MKLGFLLGTLLLVWGGALASDTTNEWTHYAGGADSQKFSYLNQINKSNVRSLHVAWTWESTDNNIVFADDGSVKISTSFNEGTPLMVDGQLLTSTPLNQVAALDPSTGKTLWVFDPQSYKGVQPPNMGFVHRGIAYWRKGSQKRILLTTNDDYLIALDTEGHPISGFGRDGIVDLSILNGAAVDKRKYSMTSPPIVCRDTIVVGSGVLDSFSKFDMPRGDVRGYDVNDGHLKWTFHTIPHSGEPGNESWQQESWSHTGNANVWTMMSADEESNSVFLPVSTPSNDWYGGERPGDGLYGESLVSLNCETGEKKWHRQLVHHGLWDYDPPAAPILMNIQVDGKPIKAIVEVTKQAIAYAFNRETGEPIWDMVEQPVPASDVPGEMASKTQPIPVKPLPYDQQGITEDDVINFSDKLHREAMELLSHYNYGPLFTPPSLKGTVVMPGWLGGASWAGAAYNPVTHRLFVPSIKEATVAKLIPLGPGSDYKYTGVPTLLPVPNGWEKDVPLFKPPYGRVTAIDMNSGDHQWAVPMGVGPRKSLEKMGVTNLPAGDLGWPRRTHLLATPELLIAAQAGPAKVVGGLGNSTNPPLPYNAMKIAAQNEDPSVVVLDQDTGEQIVKVAIPQNAFGAPMTYLANGKQYIVFAVGGAGLRAGLVALTVD